LENPTATDSDGGWRHRHRRPDWNRGTRGRGCKIWPRKNAAKNFRHGQIPQTEPRSVLTPGDPQQEWAEAIKAGKRVSGQGQFDYVPAPKGRCWRLAMRFRPCVSSGFESVTLRTRRGEQFHKRKLLSRGRGVQPAKIRRGRLVNFALGPLFAV